MYIFKVCANFDRGVEGLNIQTTGSLQGAPVSSPTVKISNSFKVNFGGGSGAYGLNTDEYRTTDVLGYTNDVLGYTKFKMCWYTCHLRSPTFMD